MVASVLSIALVLAPPIGVITLVVLRLSRGSA
jgi:hypothetical protein